MQKNTPKPKQLTPQQKTAFQLTQKNNAEIVCTIMTFALGIISSPKIFSFFFNKQRYPPNFQLPTCASAFLFILTVSTIFLRVTTKKSTPAQYEDPPSIKSVNEAMKNTIVYTLILLGLYNYLIQNWKQDQFMLKISPFILFGFLVFEFLLRLLEFLIGGKGFRYLAQAMIFFLLGILTLEAISVANL